MRGSEGRQSRKSRISNNVKDFRKARLDRNRNEEDEDRLDLIFIAIWVCIGGLSYFGFSILKGFIVQGVM